MPALLSAFDNWFSCSTPSPVCCFDCWCVFYSEAGKIRFPDFELCIPLEEERERYDLIALGRHLCRMLTTCAVVCLAGLWRLWRWGCSLLGRHAGMDCSGGALAAGGQ